MIVYTRKEIWAHDMLTGGCTWQDIANDLCVSYQYARDLCLNYERKCVLEERLKFSPCEINVRIAHTLIRAGIDSAEKLREIGYEGLRNTPLIGKKTADLIWNAVFPEGGSHD